MPAVDLFLDSSALMAGLISGEGAARILLLLGEDERIRLTISEQVLAEVERNLARKAARVLPYAREMILRSNLRILPDPPLEEVLQYQDWIRHAADVPILVSAVNARVDFLVTLNRRHFLEDSMVAENSGLRIGTPGDALAWVRSQLSGTGK